MAINNNEKLQEKNYNNNIFNNRNKNFKEEEEKIVNIFLIKT